MQRFQPPKELISWTRPTGLQVGHARLIGDCFVPGSSTVNGTTCYRASDGEVRWTTPEVFRPSARIDNLLVGLNVGNLAAGNALIALNIDSGETCWEAPRAKVPPIPSVVDGVELWYEGGQWYFLAVRTGHSVICRLDPTTGKHRAIRCKPTLRKPFRWSGGVADLPDLHTLRRVDVHGDHATVALEAPVHRAFAVGRHAALCYRDELTDEVWDLTTLTQTVALPKGSEVLALNDAFIYVHHDGRYKMISHATGEILWERPIERRINRPLLWGPWVLYHRAFMSALDANTGNELGVLGVHAIAHEASRMIITQKDRVTALSLEP